MSVGDEIELRADRPANGGAAVGRADDGRVVFVSGAIPGEQVRARIREERRGFVTADTLEIITASPHRRSGVCAAAAHGAGCCDADFVDPAHLRELKAVVLTDVLSRVGHLDENTINRALADGGGHDIQALDDADTGWRIRTRLAVDSTGAPGWHRRGDAGIITGYACAQPDPRMLTELDALGGADGFTPAAELAVVLDDAGRRHVTEIAPVPSPTRRGRSARGRGDRAAAQRRRRHGERARARRVLDGAETARHRVGARAWDIPVTGFWQGHRAAPRVYSETVAQFVNDFAGSARDGVYWDLYGGAGVFAATALDSLGAREVHLVDSDAGALTAAADTFGADPVGIHRGEVTAVTTTLPTPQVVILDPPRTGAGSAVVGQIAAAAPALVVHVGCDVARFARDLEVFGEHGYRPVAIRAFDAFPLTHHLEAIAALVPDPGYRISE